MSRRNIVVIGASSGGFEALKNLVKDLPPDLPASIFMVWHMAPDLSNVLPYVLNKANTIHASTAVDKAPIELNRIYVAPPDHHLLLEHGHMRVTKGPKENRFRPAVDPLFRSAAYRYGNQVIGVVLTGALDDGTAGLWTIKHFGGLAIVQDPADAEVASMPENARKAVQVDYCVPLADLADLLTRLVQGSVDETTHITMEERKKTEIEIKIAAEDDAFEMGSTQLGELTPFTCPECHGVLLKLQDGNLLRFRCHTGHAFSADSLLAAITEEMEDSLWNAIRSAQEGIMLLQHLEGHLKDANQTELAALYHQKAQEAEQRIQLVREAVLQHERLSKDRLREEAEEGSNR